MINEHSARYAILNIVKTPEEAQEMVEYLSSLDWQQIFNQQEERAKQFEIAEQIKVQGIKDNGGGYCDECDDLVVKLFNFPHDSSASEEYRITSKYTPMNGKYCISCIRKNESRYRIPFVMFLRIFFVFLSDNFSREFPQAAWKGTSSTNVAVAFSHITFPCRVCHFVFGKRRCMTVFSHITFRFRLAKKPAGLLDQDRGALSLCVKARTDLKSLER
jgi:hypothetical protein